MKRILIVMCGLVLLLLSACVPNSADVKEPLVMPTAVAPRDSVVVEATTKPLVTLPPAPTMEIDASVAAAATSTPTAKPVDSYMAAFVESDDTLNVRSGPGVDFEVVGELAPDTTGIRITGPGQLVVSSTWVPVESGGVRGWVNSRFLALAAGDLDFCREEQVTMLLHQLATAVENEDGDLLRQLVNDERGLRIRHSWWNPEVQLHGVEVSQAFVSEEEYEWGHQDGSGNEITGTFAEIIQPLLLQDFLGETESACGEILHGATAGLVQLPDGYDQIAYYSFFRPGTEANGEMDWGAWVVGVEQWQDGYYISFLVHFAWEI